VASPPERSNLLATTGGGRGARFRRAAGSASAPRDERGARRRPAHPLQPPSDSFAEEDHAVRPTDRLSPAVLDEMNRRLREARRRLLRTIVTTDEELATLEEREPGALGEDAAREETQEMLSRLEGRAREELEAIDAALQRVLDGTFGVCERCGGAIPLERLRAEPAARLCLTCESIREAQVR
jgi:DnaK suppressor protein